MTGAQGLSDANTRTGVLLAIITYSVWGCFPIFFKLLADTPTDEVLVHRILWSVVFSLLVVLGFKQWPAVIAILRDRRTLKYLAVSATLLAANWLIFVYATFTGAVLELSLGYFLNPLFNIVAGALIFKERLSGLVKVAIAIMTIGIALQLNDVADFPILAVVIAAVFSLYGVVRKKMAVDASSGLFLESSILVVPAFLYWVFFTPMVSLTQMQSSGWTLMLILLLGPITSIPLITFGAAVKRIPYYVMGLCQYITPTAMLLLAIFLYDEAWSPLDAITFGMIWLAIILAVYSLLTQARKSSKPAS